MAGSWRGKKPLQRNAIIALANLHDQSAIPQLLAVMKADPRPMIRATAAYAIGEIVTAYDQKIMTELNNQLDHETDLGQSEECLREFRSAIQRISQLKP